jgi:hypothetical protein
MPVFPVFADAALGPARTRVMGEAFDRAVVPSSTSFLYELRN